METIEVSNQETIEITKITNEQILFDILANQDRYSDLSKIEFDDDFLNSIQFRLKIEGKILENIPIQGHVTVDLLNVCNAWQNAIYSLYANVVKRKYDARSLTLQEREKLTLVFKFTEGSLNEYVENIKDVLNIFKDMDKAKALALIGGCVLIAGCYIGYKIIESNNDKEKFLSSNEAIAKVARSVAEEIFKGLNSQKLQIDRATIGKTELDKQQIKEIYEEMNNEENDIEEKINEKFVVTKLYHKGSKKMATLTNEGGASIDAGFAKDLFEDNEKIFMDSFSKGNKIDCEIYIERLQDGIIRKATLLKLN